MGNTQILNKNQGIAIQKYLITGRAWLYHTLSEGSFESYLACMLRDTKTLKKQYFPHALVRDADRTNQLINLLAGLENVSFTLQLVCNIRIEFSSFTNKQDGIIARKHNKLWVIRYTLSA